MIFFKIVCSLYQTYNRNLFTAILMLIQHQLDLEVHEMAL